MKVRKLADFLPSITDEQMEKRTDLIPVGDEVGVEFLCKLLVGALRKRKQWREQDVVIYDGILYVYEELLRVADRKDLILSE